MVSEVLVRYIEMEWKKNLPPHEIKKILVSRGWSEKKVEEAFDYILEYRSNEFSPPPPKEETDHFTRNAIIAVILLLTLGGGSYTYVFYGDAILENVVWGPTSCGEDFQCFLQQAASCDEASVSHTEEKEIGGLRQTRISRFETRPVNGQCELTVTWREIEVHPPDTMSVGRKNLVRNIISQAEGLQATCTLNLDKMAMLLVKWRDKGVDFTDLQLNECRGTMMNPPERVRRYVI